MILSIESVLLLVRPGFPHSDEWLFIPAIPLSILAILFIPYFVPSIIAFARKHRNAVPILLLNIFLGWTLLGWIGALIWSLTTPTEIRRPISTPTGAQPPQPPVEKRFCPNCGNQIKPTDAFCSKCGAKLT